VFSVSVDDSCEYGFVSLAESVSGLVKFLDLKFDASDGEVESWLEWTWWMDGVL